MARNKEIVGLVREAERRGFRVQQLDKGVKVMAHDGKRWAVTHWTPSDRRAVKNFRADLRRIGAFER